MKNIKITVKYLLFKFGFKTKKEMFDSIGLNERYIDNATKKNESLIKVIALLSKTTPSEFMKMIEINNFLKKNKITIEKFIELTKIYNFLKENKK